MRTQSGAVAVATLTLLASGLGVGYRWFTTSTPISKEEALRQFHEHEKKVTEASRQPPAPRISPSASPSERSVPSVAPTPKTMQHLLRPDPGVYSWRTSGFEEALGIRRSFPSESQRIITVHDDRRYRYHHFYSDEHEQWFEGRSTHALVVVPHVKERVVFGPFDAEIEIGFDPGMVFVELPLVVNRSWKGKWSGETYGDYSARVFERTQMAVDGSDVEVWGIELHIEMHGDVEGEQDLRAWIAPAHRTTVREEYIVTGRLRGKPGTYHGEWTISLLSLKPRR